MTLSYSIIGSGAVGGYYGGRLANVGKEVHFLYNTEYEHVQEHGLTVKSTHGDFHVDVNAYNAVSDMPITDIVIVCLKVLQNNLLPVLLPPLVGKNTYVVSLQNGLGSEEAIGQIVGLDRVIAGVAFICSERESPGVVGHYASGGISFGAFASDSDEIMEKISQMEQDFTQSNVHYSPGKRGSYVKWRKLLWNVPFSGLSLYYGGVTTDTIIENSERNQFARDLIHEIVAAARADGVELDTKIPGPDGVVPSIDIADTMIEATIPMGAYRPSMMVDFKKGRGVEVEAIIGEPLRRGKKGGAELPRLEELYRGINEVLNV